MQKFIYLDNVGVNVVIFSNPKITKRDKDWLYSQIIQAIKKIRDSIFLVFSPIKLPVLMNYKRLYEPKLQLSL